jgi:hypothetical protein
MSATRRRAGHITGNELWTVSHKSPSGGPSPPAQNLSGGTHVFTQFPKDWSRSHPRHAVRASEPHGSASSLSTVPTEGSSCQLTAHSPYGLALQNENKGGEERGKKRKEQNTDENE